MIFIDRLRLVALAERYNGKGNPLSDSEIALLAHLSEKESNERAEQREQWPDCYGDGGPSL